MHEGSLLSGTHLPHPPPPFFTLIYLVLSWSDNKFVLPLCVAGSLLVPVDLCCCAEWVPSSSWFNLSYTRPKRHWIKDAEGLDLPILAVNSCLLFPLFHSIFLPLTNLDSAEHGPPTPHIWMWCFFLTFAFYHHFTMSWFASSAITFKAHALHPAYGVHSHRQKPAVRICCAG